MNYNRKHIEEYDLVRVIATLLVVIGHSAYLIISTGVGGVSYLLPDDLAPTYYSPVLDGFRFLAGWVYTFHMPLFFILSGAVYIISDRLFTYDKLVVKKIKRLVLPFFVYGLLFMIPVKFIGDFYTLESLPSVIQAFLIGGESGHLWFLLALFWCFCVYHIIEKIASSIEHSFGFTIWFPLFCASLIYVLYSYIPVNYFGFKTGMSYIFFFALGAFFEKMRDKTNLTELIKSNKFKATLLFIFFVVLDLATVKYNFLNHLSIVILCSFAVYLLSVLLSGTILHKNIVFNTLLRYSFYIYIFHDPLEYIILKFTMDTGLLTSDIGCYVYLFLRVIGVIIVSVILGIFVSKLKKNISIFRKITS